MKKYFVTDFGIKPSETECCADALEGVFEVIPDGCELVLTKGRWFVGRRLMLTNKKNFVLSGENATIVAHFDNVEVANATGALGVESCENITVKRLKFDYDIPISMTARVINIDRESGVFDIKVADSYKCVGNESFEAFNSVDEEHTPDYKLVTYADCIKSYLGDNVYRINARESKIAIASLEEGALINIRHVKYGPALISFKNVLGCTLEDLTVYSSAGLTYVIHPRCSNFEFIRCDLRLPENTDRIFAANADGIHVIGLTGKLYLKDCYFENLGDDALNMHSRAGTVYEVDAENHVFKCAYGRVNTRIPSELGSNWAKPNDILNIYEQESFDHVASVKVISFEDPYIKYEPIFGEFQSGNIVGNTAYYAETHVDGCVVRNTRARAFLFQTENILVENCHIYGMSGCAMILSPDIRKWHEVGPCKNVVIRNNCFEKCGYSGLPSNIGAIAVKCCHDAGLTDSPAGVHENFAIDNNIFRNLGGSGIFALAVKGLKIYENLFENCSCKPFSDEVESLKFDIAVMNCDDVYIENNKTDHDELHEVYSRNVNFI